MDFKKYTKGELNRHLKLNIEDEKCIRGYSKLPLKMLKKMLENKNINTDEIETLKDAKKEVKEFNDENCPKFSKLTKDEIINKIIDNNLKQTLPPPLPKEQRTTDPMKRITGIKQFDKKEFFEERLEEHNIDCKLRGKEKPKDLKPFQTDFIEKFINSPVRGAVAIFGVGTGKTLTAVTAAQCYLDLYPQSKVVFISPASLLKNFVNELDKQGIDLRDPRFEYYSFEAYMRKKSKCDDALMIIDEAHNLRSSCKYTDLDAREQEEYIKRGEEPPANQLVCPSRVNAVMKYCSKEARKVLLLTGTPFVNHPYDIENLMAFIDGRDPITQSDFKDVINNDSNLKDYFRNRISIYLPDTDKDPNFPEKIEFIQLIPVNKEVVEDYERNVIEELYGNDDEGKKRDIEAFYTGYRQASSALQGKNNPKIQWVFNKIQEGDKTVVYSQFLKGMQSLQKLLVNNKIGYGVVSGNESINQKNNYVNAYNNNEIKVLLISKSGAEGLDLRETRNVILMEPYFNYAVMEQIMARGIRFKSHINLPKAEQYVNVFHLIQVSPETYKKITNNLTNAKKQFDKILKNRKTLEIFSADVFYNNLIGKPTTEKIFFKLTDTYHDFKNFMKKLEERNLTVDDAKFYFTEERYKLRRRFGNITTGNTTETVIIHNPSKQQLLDNNVKLRVKVPTKKGSRMFDDMQFIDLPKMIDIKDYKKVYDDIISGILTKEQYYEKYHIIEETRNRSNRDVSLDLLNIDLRIFIMGMEKQVVINSLLNRMEKHVEKLEDVDDYIKLNNKIKEIQDKNGNQELPYKDRVKITREFITPLIKKTISPIIEKSPEKLELQNFKSKISADKKRVKDFNFFATPYSVGKQLLNFGNFPKTGYIDVLEPNAGKGNLVSVMLERNPLCQIDMVELMTDNRNFLKDNLVDKLPNVKLMETPDFFDFETSKRYDFIVMNPPFNIKLGGKIFHDIDFVLQAFDKFLKPEGRLLAITGTSWTFNKQLSNQKNRIEELNGEYNIKEVPWKGEEIEKDARRAKMNIAFIKLDKPEEEPSVFGKKRDDFQDF